MTAKEAGYKSLAGNDRSFRGLVWRPVGYLVPHIMCVFLGLYSICTSNKTPLGPL